MLRFYVLISLNYISRESNGKIEYVTIDYYKLLQIVVFIYYC